MEQVGMVRHVTFDFRNTAMALLPQVSGSGGGWGWRW